MAVGGRPNPRPTASRDSFAERGRDGVLGMPTTWNANSRPPPPKAGPHHRSGTGRRTPAAPASAASSPRPATMWSTLGLLAARFGICIITGMLFAFFVQWLYKWKLWFAHGPPAVTAPLGPRGHTGMTMFPPFKTSDANIWAPGSVSGGTSAVHFWPRAGILSHFRPRVRLPIVCLKRMSLGSAR